MKRQLKSALMALVLLWGSASGMKLSAQYYDDNDPGRELTYQDFYDELSPFGKWVYYGDMGYVWVPDAGPDFRPYSSNGHWVWTDAYEWMWVSDYDWGWAPFHYGRWDHDSYYGWYWVPGYEWSPAWVAWRHGGGYYGWAPIRPGISISVNFNFGNYYPPDHFWSFTPGHYITNRRIWNYCLDYRQNLTIINHTTIIQFSNYSYGYGFRNGPRRYDAEIYCGRINPVRLRNSYSPGRTSYRNNEVSVFRPTVRRDEERQFRPVHFERAGRDNASARTLNGFRNDRSVQNRNDYTRERNNIQSGSRGFRERSVNEEQDRQNYADRGATSPRRTDYSIRPVQDQPAQPPGNNRFERGMQSNNDRNQSERKVFSRPSEDSKGRVNNEPRNDRPAIRRNDNNESNNFRKSDPGNMQPSGTNDWKKREAAPARSKTDQGRKASATGNGGNSRSRFSRG